MRLKTCFYGALAAVCICIAGGQALAGTEELAHAIFVKVNGKTITQNQVVDAVKYLIKREYNDTMPEDEEELEKIQKAALRDLVRTILIHDEAKNQGLKKIDRSTSKHLMEQSGLKPDEITPTIRRMLEADYLFEELMGAQGTPILSPSPKEVKDFYTKNREEFRTNAFLVVRTIFIDADSSRPQSYFKSRAESMKAELERVPYPARTEAFAKMATELSQDIFAKVGGLLTGESPERWIPKEFENQNPDGSPIFPQPMVDAIRRLNYPGEIILAVSADGMHLLYCEDIKGGKVLPWEEAARIIDYVLKQRQKDARMRAWINRIYDRSDIRWHDGTVYEKEALTEVLLPSEKGGPNQR